LEVETHCDFVLVVFILEIDDGFLDVVSAVFGEGLSGRGGTLGMTSKA
jgi:hypothetical protein